ESSLAICLAESIKGLNQDDQKISYNVGLEVTTKQQQEACELLVKNHDVFATDISEDEQTIGLRCTNIVQHYINTGDVVPIKQKPYRIPLDAQEFLQKEILKIKKLGVIQAVEEPWRSLVVIVPKKNGKKRI
ncbi:19972_t:CDS:1, partial [Racocetra fulgida]